MIALETNVKMGKSPRKVQVEIFENSETDNSELELESNNEFCSEGKVENPNNELLEQSNDAGKEDLHVGPENDFVMQESKAKGNSGWADAMQKILRLKKPKRKKTIVLSKAKKLCDVKKEKVKEEELPFTLVTEDGKVKKEKAKKMDDIIETLELIKKKRKDNLGIRIKPSIADRERERMLQKIATKGVVQLFNAVKQQQTEIHQKLTEAGPLERKREQVLKSINKQTFLDILMGDTKSIPLDNNIKDESIKEKIKEKDDKVWNVLRDDFVMGAKLKDWDKRDDSEDSSAPEDMDSDN